MGKNISSVLPTCEHLILHVFITISMLILHEKLSNISSYLAAAVPVTRNVSGIISNFGGQRIQVMTLSAALMF